MAPKALSPAVCPSRLLLNATPTFELLERAKSWVEPFHWPKLRPVADQFFFLAEAQKLEALFVHSEHEVLQKAEPPSGACPLGFPLKPTKKGHPKNTQQAPKPPKRGAFPFGFQPKRGTLKTRPHPVAKKTHTSFPCSQRLQCPIAFEYW